MEFVTVKTKYQVVIPQHIRALVPLEVGDLLEADVEDGRITFTPQTPIDRRILAGLEDLRAGRTHGPYDTVDEAMKALDARVGRYRKKRKK